LKKISLNRSTLRILTSLNEIVMSIITTNEQIIENTAVLENCKKQNWNKQRSERRSL